VLPVSKGLRRWKDEVGADGFLERIEVCHNLGYLEGLDWGHNISSIVGNFVRNGN